MPIIFSLLNEHFSGFKIYTYTGQVCRKVVSLFVGKNVSLLLRKGKLELKNSFRSCYKNALRIKHQDEIVY
jgi:hypothetical protein